MPGSPRVGTVRSVDPRSGPASHRLLIRKDTMHRISSRTRRALAGGLLTTVALIGAAGCGGDDDASAPTATTGQRPTSTAPTDERLRIVSSFANDTFPDPHSDYVEVSYGNAEMLLKPKLNDTEPWLAESVEQQSPTVWRITLRPGLKFQNGHALDARALVAFFREDWKGDTASKGLMGNPSGLTVVDERTVDVTLPKPFNPFKSAMANYTLAVYDAGEVTKVGGKYEKLAGRGIYTGPYMYVKADSAGVTYERNPNYWAGVPAMTGLDVRKVTDEQAGMRAVANDEADMQMVPAVKVKRLAKRYPDLEYATSDIAAGYAAFNLNPGKAPFTDQKVRQAFALSVDNDALSTVMDGVWRPLKGVFTDDFPLGIRWKSYDPAAAGALLDEAGWKAGADGIRTKAGKRLTVTFVTYTDDLEAIGTAAVENLRDVGFEAKLRRLPDYSGIPGALTGAGPVNAQLLNLENLGLDGNAYLSMARNYTFDKNYNLVVRDKEIAALFDTVLSSQDQAEVDAAFMKAQELNGQRVYYVPLTDEPTTMLVSKRYAGFEVDPFYVFIGWQTRPNS